MLLQYGLSHAQIRNLELKPRLPHGKQRPNYLGQYHCILRHAEQGVESDSEAQRIKLDTQERCAEKYCKYVILLNANILISLHTDSYTNNYLILQIHLVEIFLFPLKKGILA